MSKWRASPQQETRGETRCCKSENATSLDVRRSLKAPRTMVDLNGFCSRGDGAPRTVAEGQDSVGASCCGLHSWLATINVHERQTVGWGGSHWEGERADGTAIGEEADGSLTRLQQEGACISTHLTRMGRTHGVRHYSYRFRQGWP